MLREHDERAKLIAEQTLDVLGTVRREVEVPASDCQHIDLWFLRGAPLLLVPGYLLLLDALFPENCLIEAFSQAVSLSGFWESERKQLGWRHHLQGQAKAAEPGAEVPLVRRPWLWILSAGRPLALFVEHDIVERPGFPRGSMIWGGATTSAW